MENLTINGYDPYLHSDAYYYDSVAAQRPIDFARKYLTHVIGEWGGKPFILLPWQEKVIRNLFGWKRKDNNFRRYRTFFLTCGRKSGKSFLMSLLSWYFLACDDEQGSRVVLAANSVNQAGELFDVIKGQYGNFPDNLKKRFKLLKARNRIIYEPTNSYMQVCSADGGSNHGGSPHLCVWDEGSWSKRSEVYTALSTGMGARNQSLMVICSTVSNIPDNKFAELLDYAEKVRTDTLLDPDPTFLPVIYQIPKEGEGSDWTDENNWKLALPSLEAGTPKLEELRNRFKKATAIPSEQNEFLMTALNRQCDTLRCFVPLAEYNQCPHHLTLPEDLPPAFGAIDLSSNRDVSAFVISWSIGDKIYVEPHFWIPRKWATKYHQDKGIKYLDWTDQNLTITDGDCIDYPAMTKQIQDLCDKYYIDRIYYDRYKHSNVTIELDQSGVEVVAVGQDFKSMHQPTTELERLIMNRQLVVLGDNKILRWMLGNTEVRSASGLIKPEKPERHKAERKIDGVVALIMTLYGHLGERVFFDSRMVIGD